MTSALHVLSSGPAEDLEELGDYYEETAGGEAAERRFFAGELLDKDEPKHYVTRHSGYGHPSGYGDKPRKHYEIHSGYGGAHSSGHGDSGYGHSGYGHSGYGHDDHSGYGHSGHHGYDDGHSGYSDEPLIEFGLPGLGSLGIFKACPKQVAG